MAIQAATVAAAGVAPAAPAAPPRVKGAPTSSAQSKPSQKPDSVTISARAKSAAVHSGQTLHIVANHASAATSTPQMTTNGYAAKVRAALNNNPNLTPMQAMAAAGVPQAEQQQVAAALGAAPSSAQAAPEATAHPIR